MPEGDVVWRTARQLREALAGQVLIRSDFRVPRYATTNLVGRTVLDSVSRGKHLLTRVEGDITVHTHLRMEGSWRISRMSTAPLRDHRIRLVLDSVSRGKHLLTRVDGDITVHTHLRMEGSWRISRTSTAQLRDHRIRLVLANENWQAIGHQLGIVEVIRTSRESETVGHLGPDLLGYDWDNDEAVRRLTAEPERPIGESLMDQRNLAGIGNMYKSETLFLRGVSPWRQTGDVTDLADMVELARKLLDANKDRGEQVITGDRARGEQTWVYGRARRPCRRCGTAIRRADQGQVLEERVTFWCPRCQPT